MLIACARSDSTFSHTFPPHICHAPACRVPCIEQRNTGTNSLLVPLTDFDQQICDLALTHKLTKLSYRTGSPHGHSPAHQAEQRAFQCDVR